MNNMNEWITHLQHPLVLAGFGLFVFALIIRPLFLNSKKLSGPLIAPLLRWGMILLFILAAMAMIGGFALSWKATPAAGSGISLSKEEYRQMLQEELRTAAKEMQAPGLAAEERHLLEQKAKVLEEQLADFQKSYEEKLARLKAAEKALDELKGQLPDARIAEAKLRLAKGDTKAAEQIFDEVADKEGKAAALANYQGGQLAEGRIDYAKAMRQYKKAVTLEEDNPDYLQAAGNMARTLGDYAQAQEWLVRLVKMEEGKKNEDKCHSCAFSTLAIVYSDMGRYAEAESLLKDDLVIKEQALGKEHQKVATVLNNLASLYKDQGKYAEAEPLYKRSLEIWEKALGKEHPHVAAALNNLALLYKSQGRDEEAEPLYKRSLETREQKLGKDHPDVATTLNNLAALYYAQGRYEEAEPLYKRSLETREQKLGKDHPDVATTLNTLAWLYKAQGRYEEAEPLYLRSLSIFKAKLPADHPHIKTVQENYDALKKKMAGM
uniref:tetratricopeptide repeat protein n=1 Tax=Candidatus Electronema sp. TaxID=2698783 RepID=UPI004055FAC8